MFNETTDIVRDRQQGLRHEAAQHRLVTKTIETTLRQHLTAVASVVKAAFPGIDVAQGSVFPATH